MAGAPVLYVSRHAAADGLAPNRSASTNLRAGIRVQGGSGTHCGCRARHVLAALVLGISCGMTAPRAACAAGDEPVLSAGETLGFADGESGPVSSEGGSAPTFFDTASQSAEPPDRPLGSAFFGGDRGEPVFAPAQPAAGKAPPKWPNIKEPGPDMGDFPNSAFTLPKGRAYIEFSPVTLFNADRQNPQGYVAPYLLRYGVTDNVEFRIFGNGITSLGGSAPTTGFSPLNLDLKVHLWNDRKEWFIPASSLEVFLLTTWGSQQFNGGWQPSINMNFDLPMTKKLNLEWTFGYGGVQQAININTHEIFIPRFNFLVPGIHRSFNLNFNQFSAQWAIEYEVTDQLEIFVHGFHNGAILLNLGAGEMIGVGAFWKFNSRLIAFGSVNTGLTPNLPSIAAQLGFAVALP